MSSRVRAVLSDIPVLERYQEAFLQAKISVCVRCGFQFRKTFEMCLLAMSRIGQQFKIIHSAKTVCDVLF